MELKDNIKRLCQANGISVAELAKQTKVPKQTLHGWTLGRRSVDPDQLKRVAAALKVSLHELVFGEPDPFESKSAEILKEIFSGDVRVTLHRIERRRR